MAVVFVQKKLAAEADMGSPANPARIAKLIL
jgi:hypothetical protein